MRPQSTGDPLLRRLHKLASRVAADRIAARLVLAAGPITLLPLIVVALDHSVAGGLPRALMALCGPAWGVLGLIGVIWAWRTGRAERPGALSAARLYERRAGVPHNTLVNALLVWADPARRFAHPAAAIESARAMSATPADVEFERIAPRRSLLVLSVVAAAWILYAWLAPKPVGPSLARFFGATLPAPTATRIEWVRPQPGDPIYVGDPLEIEVRVSGRPAEAVWFERLPASGSPQPPPPQRFAFARGERSESGDRWLLTLAPNETAARIRYRVVAGDSALSGELQLLPQPAEEQARLVVAPPAYVGEPPFPTDAPDVRVWSGSRVEFDLQANTEVHDPVLVLASASQTQRVQMGVSGEERRVARISLPIRQGATYWYEFEDAWGRRAIEGMRRTLRVRSDAPPSVQIVDPRRGDAADERYEITETPRLVVVARDDIRLTELTLVLQRGNRTDRRPLAITDARPIRERRLAIATHDLQVPAGEEVRCWFEARDNHQTPDGHVAAQSGQSRVIMLTHTPVAPEIVPPPADFPDDGDAGAKSDSSGEGTGERVRGNRPGDAGGDAESGESGSSQAGAAAGQAGAGQAAAGEAGAVGAATGGAVGRAGGDVGEAAPADGPPPPDGDANGESAGDAGDRSAEADGAQEQLGEQLREFARRFGREAKKLTDQESEPAGADPGPDSGDRGDAPASRPSDGDAESPQNPPVDSPASQPAGEDAGGARQPEQQHDPPDTRSPASQPVNAPGTQGSTASDEPDAESNEASQAADSSDDGSSEESASTAEAASRPPEADTPADSAAASQPSTAEGMDQQQSSAEGGRQGSQGSSAADSGEDSGASGGDDGESAGAAGEAGESGASSGSPAGEAAGGESGAADGDAAAQDGGREDAADSSAGGAGGGGGGEQASESPGDGAGHDQSADEMDAVLELLDRFGELREADLKELGLSEEQRLEFIREFDRLKQAAEQAGVLGELRRFVASAELGSTIPARGAPGVIGVAADATEDAAYADGLPPIVAPREQQAPPELQAILDAYYRSLAARRTRSRTSEDD